MEIVMEFFLGGVGDVMWLRDGWTDGGMRHLRDGWDAQMHFEGEKGGFQLLNSTYLTASPISQYIQYSTYTEYGQQEDE